MVICPKCNKEILGPEKLGFTADLNWFHACSPPPAANDSEKPQQTSPASKPLTVRKPLNLSVIIQ